VITPLRECEEPRVVAIGETGLDYRRLPSEKLAKEEQVQVDVRPSGLRLMKKSKRKSAMVLTNRNRPSLFQQQLDLAVELGLNVVIHQRDAWEDTLKMMTPYTGKLRPFFMLRRLARAGK